MARTHADLWRPVLLVRGGALSVWGSKQLKQRFTVGPLYRYTKQNIFLSVSDRKMCPSVTESFSLRCVEWRRTTLAPVWVQTAFRRARRRWCRKPARFMCGAATAATSWWRALRRRSCSPSWPPASPTHRRYVDQVASLIHALVVLANAKVGCCIKHLNSDFTVSPTGVWRTEPAETSKKNM